MMMASHDRRVAQTDRMKNQQAPKVSATMLGFGCAPIREPLEPHGRWLVVRRATRMCIVSLMNVGR
jgi:hypothetical protein